MMYRMREEGRPNTGLGGSFFETHTERTRTLRDPYIMVLGVLDIPWRLSV